MKRTKTRRGKRVAQQPTMAGVVQEAVNANAIPTRRMPFCECGCSGLMHGGAKSLGSCLLHPTCKKYKERD